MMNDLIQHLILPSLGSPQGGLSMVFGVYPGIDLLYYGNQGRLEYDFEVVAGADPGLIRLSLEGMEGATLDRMAEEFRDTPGDVLEHRVATSLGTLPQLPDALQRLKPGTRTVVPKSGPSARPGRAMRRIALGPGVDLLIDESHPAWHDSNQFSILSARVVETLASLRHSDSQN